MLDLSDTCVLAIDDNLSSNYVGGGDIFSHSDSYPTLSHMLSASDTQLSPSLTSQQSAPTIQRQVAPTSNCHMNVTLSQPLQQQQALTVSAQPRQSLPLGNSVLL